MFCSSTAAVCRALNKPFLTPSHIDLHTLEARERDCFFLAVNMMAAAGHHPHKQTLLWAFQVFQCGLLKPIYTRTKLAGSTLISIYLVDMLLL